MAAATSTMPSRRSGDQDLTMNTERKTFQHTAAQHSTSFSHAARTYRSDR
jgi:hypothetical protein